MKPTEWASMAVLLLLTRCGHWKTCRLSRAATSRSSAKVWSRFRFCSGWPPRSLRREVTRLKEQRMNRRFWQIRAAADDPKIGEVLLYGEIGAYKFWGDEVIPKEFKEELDALGDVDELRVFINSPGGDVFAGQAIHSMLKRHPAHVSVYVDGLAASIASVIAMAGETVIMPLNAMMMIHQPWTWASGNAEDFRRLADDLDKVAESIVAAYESKTGLDRDEIVALMDAETWMTAEEAVELGFADRIEESKQIAASLRDGVLVIQGHEVDLSRYRNPPKILIAQAGVTDESEPEPEEVPEPTLEREPEPEPEPE